MQQRAYGEWASPIRAAAVALSEVAIGSTAVVGEQVWWSETRPAEGGRVAVVRRSAEGAVEDVLPAPWQARTRVHEYGGLAWAPFTAPDRSAPSLVFANWDDQRLYVLHPEDDKPTPITPIPDRPAGLRYADLAVSPGSRELLCVREAHGPEGVSRHIVAVPLDGSAEQDPAVVREVVGGSDFLAYPRLSHDGARLAWMAWDHPRMPWDGSEVRLADLGDDGTAGPARTLIGGEHEAVFQPEWADAATLYVASDRTGWFNLYAVDATSGEARALCPRQEEFAVPLWQLGYRRYTLLDDGRVASVHGTSTYALGVLDPGTGELHDLDLPFSAWGSSVVSDGARVVGVAGGSAEPLTLVRVDVASGGIERLHASTTDVPDAAYLPVPDSLELPGPAGRTVHAHLWAPRNPDFQAPEGELPPYVVHVHGGPTAQSLALLDLEIAYFTSRGIGVIEVNYGGSTGYGRAYRQLLDGQWGVVDVEDSVAAAQALVDQGLADGARMAIEGGSAGGWTTLSAVTRTDFFSAGVSYFGVAELLRFAEDTHDFESRYLDGLIGPLPEAHDLYVERAPLSHVDRISCPVLLLQGAEDEVVPPSQSLMFRDALAAKGIPHAYIEFPGEQHGFRKQESIVASLEASLSFYGQVFGFDPPEVPRLELSTG
ncbi:MAG: hypothetical protein QOE01_2388 [Actinomycetota bacterium]|jgi:dipeptidyl aminopeptidase/acylaminoacyl peptidase|nr:hypothetical protein [Actinomycetota bacterium]